MSNSVSATLPYLIPFRCISSSTDDRFKRRHIPRSMRTYRRHNSLLQKVLRVQTNLSLGRAVTRLLSSNAMYSDITVTFLQATQEKCIDALIGLMRTQPAQILTNPYSCSSRIPATHKTSSKFTIAGCGATWENPKRQKLPPSPSLTKFPYRMYMVTQICQWLIK